MESTLPQVASTALINISLAWIVGVLASRLWLIKQTAEWQKTVVKRLSPAMLAGLTACLLGVFLSLWTESAAMGDVAWLDAWPSCVQMMTTTHYGHAGVVAMALLVLAMATHWLLKGTDTGLKYVGSLTVLVMLVLAVRVTIGHAYEHGPFSFAVWVEWMHLLLMSVWTGVVFIAGWVVLPRVQAAEKAPTKERASYLSAMSDWAAVALAGILATGAYNSYRVLGSPRDLVEADYGQVLVFKLCFVLVAIALGGYNKFVGLPAAVATAPPASAKRGLHTAIAVLRIESIALLLVLIAAAVLTSSAPPGQ